MVIGSIFGCWNRIECWMHSQLHCWRQSWPLSAGCCSAWQQGATANSDNYCIINTCSLYLRESKDQKATLLDRLSSTSAPDFQASTRLAIGTQNSFSTLSTSLPLLSLPFPSPPTGLLYDLHTAFCGLYINLLLKVDVYHILPVWKVATGPKTFFMEMCSCCSCCDRHC